MDEGLVNVLTDLCFQEEERVPSDLLFVFGSNVKHQEIATLISKLIAQNGFNQVIITGGIANFGNSYHQNRPESEAIYAHLPEKHKQRNIILETSSKDLFENIEEAEKLIDFEKVKTITFICHAYASKRASLSLKTFFPNTRIYCIPFPLPSDHKDFPINSEHWSKTKYGQSLILGEYLRIITYGNRGDFPLTSVQAHLDQVERLLLNK